MQTNKVSQQSLRSEVAIALARERRPAFWITLNVYRECSPYACRRLAERFFYRMHRSLFRATRYEGIPTRQLLRINGSPERGKRNEAPHMHILTWVHPHAADKFASRAQAIWSNLAPVGEAHVVEVQPGPESHAKLAWYLTKDCDVARFSTLSFTEEDLDLPEHGGPIAKKRARTRIK